MTIENMVVTCPGKVLEVEDLPGHIRPDGIGAGVSGFPVGTTIQELERELIRNTLLMVEGNRRKAAEILGIGERTLYRKIDEYGLREPGEKAAN